MYTRKCDYCGKHYKGYGAKYCSRECFREAYKKAGKVVGFQKGDLNPSRKPERRKQISEQMKNRITSEETKRKISHSMEKALKNPELRKKWSQCKMGGKPTEETKRKIAIAKAKRLPKDKKMSTLIKNADIAHSKYIRLKESKDGYNKCVSCGRVYLISEMDCGHFVGRAHMSTRYLDKNTHPQCRRCNRFQEGNKDEYALWLIKKYGEGIIEELNRKKWEMKHFSPDELDELTKDRRAKIKELEKLISES